MSYLVYNFINNSNECVIGTEFSTGTSGLLDLNVKEVIIPSKYFDRIVTIIGYNAFAGSNIEKVFIPKTIRVIVRGAFYKCEKLIEVSFEKGSKLQEIGIEAFAYCYNMTFIDLPSSLTTFGEWQYPVFGGISKLKCLSYFGSSDFSSASLFSGSAQVEVRVSSAYSGTFGGRTTSVNLNRCANNQWYPIKERTKCMCRYHIERINPFNLIFLLAIS